jgi:methylated-DNA-protein-cysteine methyltransferase-like protein
MTPEPGDTEDPSEEQMRILRAVKQIPPGFVSTYGRVAAAAGYSGRARLVGHVLRTCPLAEGVPWHRVVNGAGRVSERPGTGADQQQRRLAAEGVELDAGGRIDLSVYLWCI